MSKGVNLSCVKLSVVSICPGVKLSYMYNPVKQSRSNSVHSSAEVLLFIYVCPHIVILDQSYITQFALDLHFIM